MVIELSFLTQVHGICYVKLPGIADTMVVENMICGAAAEVKQFLKAPV